MGLLVCVQDGYMRTKRDLGTSTYRSELSVTKRASRRYPGSPVDVSRPHGSAVLGH